MLSQAVRRPVIAKNPIAAVFLPTRQNLVRVLRAAALSLVGFAAFALGTPAAHALPSYARQTGQDCAACHNGFPELTPYGRLFKLNAFTFRGGQSNLPPLAMMLVPSFTHTDSGQPGGAAPHFGPNDNFSFSGSLFYGGAIASSLGIGAFAQVTYDHAKRHFNWDNSDVRYAHATSLLNRETVFGVTVNNNPTLTDLWNSTPAWGYPFVSSSLAPTPAAATLIEGGLAQKVVGTTAYNFWNRLIYTEAGVYRTLSPTTLTTLGINPGGTSAIKNVAPYWRLAVAPSWGQNSFEVGAFGIAATLIPQRVRDSGTDHLTDVGFDAQYQWLGARQLFAGGLLDHREPEPECQLGAGASGEHPQSSAQPARQGHLLLQPNLWRDRGVLQPQRHP
jgi:hypothetical protein